MILKSLNYITAFAVICVCLVGCGGGTRGTGTGDGTSVPFIEGNVRLPNGAAVPGATIMLLQTGEKTATDENGDFQLSTAGTPDKVDLSIASDGYSDTVSVVKPAQYAGQALQLSIKIDKERRRITVKQLDVIVRVDGACDYAFENNRVIRQGNRLASGTVCRIEVKIGGDGQQLSHIPFIMERSSCVVDDWNVIAAGETGSGGGAGVGTLDFTYKNDERDCRYRILVPYEVPGLTQLAYYIDTYRKQEFDQKAN